MISNYSSGAALLTASQVAALGGCHINTVRNAVDAGRLKAVRLGPKGWRRIRLSDAEEFFGLKRSTKRGIGEKVTRILCYARVSSSEQGTGWNSEKNESKEGLESGLSRQVERLKGAAKERGENEPVVFSDVGSGMNPDRRSFGKMLDGILAGKFQGAVLLLTYRERLIRFNYQLVEKICKFGGVTIEILDRDKEEETDLLQEITEDIVALIGHMHARVNGAKAARICTKLIPPAALERAKALYDEQLPISQIQEILEREKWTTSHGDKISLHVLRRYLVENIEAVEAALPKQEVEHDTTSIERFVESEIIKTEERLDRRTGKVWKMARLGSGELYEAYAEWCKERDEEPLSHCHVGKLISQRYDWKTVRINGRIHFKCINLKSRMGVA